MPFGLEHFSKLARASEPVMNGSKTLMEEIIGNAGKLSSVSEVAVKSAAQKHLGSGMTDEAIQRYFNRPAEQFLGSRERNFVIEKGEYADVRRALAHENGGTKLLLREIPPNKDLTFTESDLGPQLKTWVQHYNGANGPRINQEMAEKADLLIFCHPHRLAETIKSNEMIRSILGKHIFPYQRDEVVLAQTINTVRGQARPIFTVMMHDLPKLQKAG